jgi:glutaminase
MAVFAPPLDEAGNSVKAQKAIAFVANKLGINVFSPASVGLR